MIESKLRQILAPAPSTQRLDAVHLSYDVRSDRLAYASHKSVVLRRVGHPEDAVQYNGHVHATKVATFSPSGHYVASGDHAGNVKVWSAAGEEIILKNQVKALSGAVRAISWDDDSQRILACGDGKDTFGRFFTFDTGNSVGQVMGHISPVNAGAMNHSRPFRAATGSDDSTIVIYFGTPYRMCRRINAHSGFVHDLAFAPNDHLLASVGGDRKVQLYDGKSGDFVKMLGSHQGTVYALAWMDDSQRLISCSADRTVTAWDVETGISLKSWVVELSDPMEAQQVGVVSTPSTIVSLSFCGDLNYFDLRQDRQTRTIRGTQKSITALETTPPSTLWTGSYDGRIVHYELELGEAMRHHGHENLIVALRQKGKKILSISLDDTLQEFASDRDNHYAKLKLGKQPVDLVIVGDYTLVAEEGGVVLFHEFNKLHSIAVDGPITCLASGKLHTSVITVGTKNGLLINYRLKEQEIVCCPNSPLKLQTGYGVTALSQSPDGKYCAVGDTSGKVTIYEYQDQDSTLQLKLNQWHSQSGRITHIAWRPDGCTLASASLDTTVMIYDLLTPTSHTCLGNIHKEGATGLAWIDSGVLVTTGRDASIRIWDIASV